jgi:hypothetical protein
MQRLRVSPAQAQSRLLQLSASRGTRWLPFCERGDPEVSERETLIVVAYHVEESMMRILSVKELALVSGGCGDDGGGGGGDEHCNNGWGNGEDCSPGMSGEHQPKFDDPNTGPSPANSPASADGDR